MQRADRVPQRLVKRHLRILCLLSLRAEVSVSILARRYRRTQPFATRRPVSVAKFPHHPGAELLLFQRMQTETSYSTLIAFIVSARALEQLFMSAVRTIGNVVLRLSGLVQGNTERKQTQHSQEVSPAGETFAT